MGCGSSNSISISQASPSQNKILVLGATGLIGSSTVRALSKQKENVTAGVRDTSKAHSLQTLGAKIVQADMAQSQSELTKIFSNYNTLFVVTPGSVDRVKLTINAIKAAQDAKIGYIMIVSLPCAGDQNVIFGRQLGEIKSALLESGLHYGILNLPFFIENMFGSAPTISSHNTFYGPVDGSCTVSTVNSEDAGLAAAAILTNPSKYHKQTFNIICDHTSFDGVAKQFSQGLGREIKHVNVGFENTKGGMLSAGMEEWYVNGVLELYKYTESKNEFVNVKSDDFKKLTGKNPQSNEEWVRKNAVAFCPKSS